MEQNAIKSDKNPKVRKKINLDSYLNFAVVLLIILHIFKQFHFLSRYTTKTLNEETTPKAIKAMLAG